jgi:NAD(P)-dependent dehydrogenase (short-subunit alcohol dehydrogenase family)
VRGLAGKVIVVVGGGTAESGPGNGAATAIRLADEGARVAVGDLRLDAAEATVALVAERGGDAFAMESDVASDESVRALVAAAVAEYGGVDGLHVNAADMSAEVLGVDGDSELLTIPLAVWQRTIDVNLTGFVLAARAVVPQLLQRGGGGIVNTVSDAVYVGEDVRVAYAATKTALTAVTRHIASRWGRDGIRCNSISPGIIVRNEELADVMESRHRREPRAARTGHPDDIAATSAFLLSDDGAFVNGQIWSVNGGRTRSDST